MSPAGIAVMRRSGWPAGRRRAAASPGWRPRMSAAPAWGSRPCGWGSPDHLT